MIYLIFLFHIFTWNRSEETMPGLFRFIQTWNIISILMYIITVLTLISMVIYLIENRAHFKHMINSFYRLSNQ